MTMLDRLMLSFPNNAEKEEIGGNGWRPPFAASNGFWERSLSKSTCSAPGK